MTTRKFKPQVDYDIIKVGNQICIRIYDFLDRVLSANSVGEQRRESGQTKILDRIPRRLQRYCNTLS